MSAGGAAAPSDQNDIEEGAGAECLAREEGTELLQNDSDIEIGDASPTTRSDDTPRFTINEVLEALDESMSGLQTTEDNYDEETGGIATGEPEEETDISQADGDWQLVREMYAEEAGDDATDFDSVPNATESYHDAMPGSRESKGDGIEEGGISPHSNGTDEVFGAREEGSWMEANSQRKFVRKECFATALKYVRLPFEKIPGGEELMDAVDEVINDPRVEAVAAEKAQKMAGNLRVLRRGAIDVDVHSSTDEQAPSDSQSPTEEQATIDALKKQIDGLVAKVAALEAKVACAENEADTMYASYLAAHQVEEKRKKFPDEPRKACFAQGEEYEHYKRKAEEERQRKAREAEEYFQRKAPEPEPECPSRTMAEEEIKSWKWIILGVAAVVICVAVVVAFAPDAAAIAFAAGGTAAKSAT